MPELKNVKHERLAQEYLIDLNQSQAYIRAGYSAKGANAGAARVFAYASIRARVDELMAERSTRTGVTQDRVVRELGRVAFLDPTKLINLKDAMVKKDATEDDRACIASVKVKEGDDFTEREVRFADKLKALELLGKHLGMFTDRVTITDERPVIVIGVSPEAEDG